MTSHLWVLNLPPRLGHTQTVLRLAEVLAEDAPIILVGTHLQAAQLREHDVDARAIGNFGHLHHGVRVPVLFDLTAVQRIVTDYEHEISHLREQLKQQA